MKVRAFNKSDYSTVCEWWAAHKWPVIAYELLPSTGLIVEDRCAGFIYKTDSGFCLFEWVVSNPNTNKEERSEALDTLINEGIKLSKEMGFKVIFTCVSHPKLIERYKKHEYQVTDSNVTTFVRVL